MSGRLPTWDMALASYLAQVVPEVREGRDDLCALFAAGAVEAVTGDNPAARFRGRYAEVAEALEATIDGLFPEVPRAFAQRGDLAWYDGSVGVVVGGDALFVGDNDLEHVPRALWVKAWGVGRG